MRNSKIAFFISIYFSADKSQDVSGLLFKKRGAIAYYHPRGHGIIYQLIMKQ